MPCKARLTFYLCCHLKAQISIRLLSLLGSGALFFFSCGLQLHKAENAWQKACGLLKKYVLTYWAPVLAAEELLNFHPLLHILSMFYCVYIQKKLVSYKTHMCCLLNNEIISCYLILDILCVQLYIYFLSFLDANKYIHILVKYLGR